jgi:hypothetical protein
MTDFAIAQSFVKSHRSILLMTPLRPPCRYFATRDSSGFITRPTLDPGDWARELQTVKQVTFGISNNDRKFRLIGDDGWSDSLTTGRDVSASFDTYFSKSMVQPAAGACPEFRGNYSEEFAIVERARNEDENGNDNEVYVEMFKELGRANGATGDFIYDYAGFNATLLNYKEPQAADDLVNVTFEAISRGRCVFGRFNSGAAPLATGMIQSVILATAPTSGTRRYAVVPVDNGSAIVVTANQTVTYTSDGTVALTQLALGAADGSGFRIELASTGARIPAVVTLAANVVTINPVSDLAAATIYRLVVRDGAITQAVDSNLVASATGIRRPLAGFSTTFRTA